MKAIAPALGVAVLVIVAVFIFAYERSNAPAVPAAAPGVESAGAPGLGAPMPNTSGSPIVPLASPVTAAPNSGGGGNQAAPGLSDLVGRIETKVKSDPSNIGNRILLAQTYGELGRLDDGIAELRKLYTEKIDTGRVDMVLASLLIKSATPPALSEAAELLDKAVKRDAAQKGFVQLYKGRLFVAQGKTDAAVKLWNDAMKKLPATDAARIQIEEELSKRKS